MDDEISQGSEHDFRLPWWPRLPPGRWRVLLAVAALAGAAVAGTLVLASPGGRPAKSARPLAHPSAHPSQRASAQPAQVPGPAYTSSWSITITATSVPAPATTVKPATGTVLVSCGAAQYTQLDPQWRQRSLSVGPVAFLDSRDSPYVSRGRPAGPGADLPGQAPLTVAANMTLELGPGVAVVLKPAAGTSGYFRFANGFDFNGPVPLPAGDTGFTVVGCPAGTSGQDDGMSTYYLAYNITPNRQVPVELWTSPSAKPIWLTFTAPQG